MQSEVNENGRVTALLPMKGHSARVPGKNFRELGGKPLFRWILDELLSMDEIDRVVINTDARDVLLAKGLPDDNRVIIRDREPELCGDDVSMNLVLADDIAAVEADTYLMTHTTNPFLGAATMRDALTRYAAARSAGDADSLFGVNRFQTRFYRADGTPVNHDPANLVKTQDLEPWFEENSTIYLFSRDSFKNAAARIGRNPMMYVTPKPESIDIDTPDDWAFADLVARARARGAMA